MNLYHWVRLARPQQWLKNLMLFFPPFLSGAAANPGLLTKGGGAFLAFCCASSAGYIVNDLYDLKQDAMHPLKSGRPLPSGAISLPSAGAAALLFIASALALSLGVTHLFLGYILLYLLISFAYSVCLKNQPVLDIFCISSGFVLRLYAGGTVFDVVISDWLFLTVFLLAIFLSIGKRSSEQRNLGEDSAQHRAALGKYPRGFLDSAMVLSGASVLVTYAIYVISKPMLVYSVPLCLFGLLRYLYRVKSGGDGDPTASLLKDPWLLLTGVAWVLFVTVCVYR